VYSKIVLKQVNKKLEDIMIKTSPTTKKTTFQVTLPDVDSVVLVGDFNNWNSAATPMKKSKSGVWKADLALKAGEYQFRYLVNDYQWMNDEDVPVVLNEFGSHNSVAKVELPAKKTTATKKTTAKKSTKDSNKAQK
jgi:1,4-alpha-glucan branching enzyme